MVFEFFLKESLTQTSPTNRRVPERDVTSDPEMQKKIAEDPLWYKGGLKLNMGTLLVECVKEYITVDELAKLTMPLLIMNGDQDTVTHPHGAKVRTDINKACPSLNAKNSFLLMPIYSSAVAHSLKFA